MPTARESGVGNFPARTVTILSLCMTLNIYSMVSLFPYVGFMVQDLLGLESTNESGYYAGYVASAFTFGRFTSSYYLGQVTDSAGRKPVIIAGLLSIMVFSLAFGLSPTFGFAVSSRLLLGLTNGMAPALRATTREACGEEHVVEGLTYFGGCKSFSLVLGTAMGGLLAQPATNYPNQFSATGLLGRYPYLLPNLAASIGALILLPLVAFYLPETKDFGMQRARGELQSCSDGEGATTEHVPKIKPDLAATSGRSKGAGKGSFAYESMVDDKDGGGLSQQRDDSLSLELQEADGSKAVNAANRGACQGDVHVISENVEPGLWGPDGLLAVPHVKLVLFVVGTVQALVIGFEEAYPLWALSTPAVGGLGWGTIDIGKVFLVAGFIVAVSQLIVFPKIIKVVGITIWQRVGCLMCIPSFMAIPYAKALSWNDNSLFMVSVATTTFVYSFQGMITLVLSIGSTSMVQSDMRGKLGGLYNMSESLGRFLGPVGFATMFAWSISPSAAHWIDYHFVFFVAAASMTLVAILAWGTVTSENMMAPADRTDGVDVPVVCNSSDHQKGGSSGTISRSGRESDLI